MNIKIPTSIGIIIILLISFTAGAFIWKYKNIVKQNENINKSDNIVNQHWETADDNQENELDRMKREWRECREVGVPHKKNNYYDWKIDVTKVDMEQKRILGYIANDPDYLVTGENYYILQDMFLSDVKEGDEIEIIGSCEGKALEVPNWNPHRIFKEDDYRYVRFSGITKQQLLFDDNMDNWKSYQNKEYGYEIKYPSVYGEIDDQTTKGRYYQYVYIGGLFHHDFNIMSYYEKHEETRLVDDKNCNSQEILFSQDKNDMIKTYINGIEAYSYEYFHCGGPDRKRIDYVDKSYYIPTMKGKIVEIAFSNWLSDKYQYGPVDINYQERILSTFKFMN
jgi:hypothetical protein